MRREFSLQYLPKLEFSIKSRGCVLCISFFPKKPSVAWWSAATAPMATASDHEYLLGGRGSAIFLKFQHFSVNFAFLHILLPFCYLFFFLNPFTFFNIFFTFFLPFLNFLHIVWILPIFFGLPLKLISKYSGYFNFFWVGRGRVWMFRKKIEPRCSEKTFQCDFYF